MGPLGFEVGNHGVGIGKMLRKKYRCSSRIGKGGKADRAFVREEQGHGKTSVGVGEANKHVARSGPYVEGFALDQGAAIRPGGYNQFLVSVLDYLFSPLHCAFALQGLTDSRVGTVG